MLKTTALSILALGTLATLQAPAQAQIQATATISSTPISGGFEYALSLTNTGTTNIGTFWFAWTPGYDNLPSAPTLISSPSGWSGIDAPDTFSGFFHTHSAQWTTPTPTTGTGSLLLPGQTLSGFVFDSPDSPAVLAGNAVPVGDPVTTSYVYIGAPEADPGFTFKPAVVSAPEPASIALLSAVPALLLKRRRR